MTTHSLGRALTRRQIELADAALAIITRDGLPALSFRAVAEQDGCSLGSVQKAFPSKTHMIAATFTRLRQTAATLPEGEPGRPTLRGWLIEFACCVLPLDAARAAAQRQADAFAGVAASDPAIAEAIAASDDELRGLLAKLVARAAHEGEVPAHVQPDFTAWAILALIQGTATQLGYQQRPEGELRDRLARAIDRLLA